MLKRNLAVLAAAAMALGSAAAGAAQSTFPSSPNETASYTSRDTGPASAPEAYGTGATGTPSSPSEARPFWFSWTAPRVTPDRRRDGAESVFPTSPNESGAYM